MGHHGHAHAHGQGHGDSVPPPSVRPIMRAFWITLFFMFLEFVGGWVSGSLALTTDALHMMTDAGAMALGIFAFWLSRKPVTPTMSFGYYRAEVLAGLVSGLSIWFLSGLLIYEAFTRFRSPPPISAPVVVVLAVLGMVVNLVTMRILKDRHENLNIRAVYLHVLSDFMGSVATLVSGVVLWLTDWRLIDPLVTLVSAALVLWSSWNLVKESLGVLMESVPEGIHPEAVKKDLLGIAGVTGVHDLHIWTVSSGRLALSAHVIAKSSESVLTSANAMLEERYGIIHTTLQIEHPDGFRSDRCFSCT